MRRRERGRGEREGEREGERGRERGKKRERERKKNIFFQPSEEQDHLVGPRPPYLNT